MSIVDDHMCGVREEAIQSSPLICTKCKQNFHGSCVKSNENVQSWSCPKCLDQLNPPSAPRSQRQRSTTSRFSERAKSVTSSKARAEMQLKLLEEQELLMKQQSREKEAALLERKRQIEEKESCLKQLADEIKKRHEKEQEILHKKSMLLDTICDSSQGSDKISESSSAKARGRVEAWQATFVPDIQAGACKESTAIQRCNTLAEKLPQSPS